jgi:hypothetical protein
MSTLVNGVPDFLYKPAAIDPQLFPAIQEEAYALFLKMYAMVKHDKRIFYYFEDFKNQFGDLAVHCPVLFGELRRLKIHTLFDRILFVQNYYNREKPMPAHRDHPDEFNYDHFGLNIPVRGYQGSYTVFYDGDIDPDPLSWDKDAQGTQNIATALLGKPHTLREIARVETTGPMWINTYALHAGRSDSENPRLILSLRFNSMQHIFDNGYFDEHLVAK